MPRAGPASGFSTNSATAKTPSTPSRSHAALDIAIAGLGALGRDAKADQGAAACRGRRRGRRRRGRRLASPIVWSEGITSISGSGSVSLSARAATQAAGAVLRPTGSSRSARGATRDLAQLLGDDEPMLFIGDEEGGGETARRSATRANGLLQQAVLAEERQELLRVERARHRPQPGARTTGQNDRVNHPPPRNLPRLARRRRAHVDIHAVSATAQMPPSLLTL